MREQKSSELQTTDIWRKYEAGKDHHNAEDFYRKVERCHKFYEGDQWSGCKTGGEELPVLNFIRPICKYKISTVAMTDTAIIYSPMTDDPAEAELCKALTEFAAQQWEQGKMDVKKWAIIKNACLAGDHYLYVFDARPASESVAGGRDPQLEARLIDKTALYLADEQEPDINAQEWMIISERRPVSQVREEAKKNGISEDEIKLIVSDDVDETGVGYTSADEVKTDLGKCTSLLYMTKGDDGMRFCRSTKSCIYQPEKSIPGLTVYPVCGMRWDEKTGSARGIGVVEGLIPNQIEVNKTLARRAICVKRYSFPTAIVDDDKVVNADALGKVGATVKVRNLAGNPLSSMVSFLNPQVIGGDAAALQTELVSMSRELEGASDAATGQVDPTKASGEAIKAARDQSAMSLNEQSANYKQFCEDLARIWFKLWMVYGAAPDESGEALRALDVSIRIDISPVDPYSVLSREMSLENALNKQYITFEEYVDALDDNSGVPKDKFASILQKRQDLAAQQAEMQASQPDAAMPDAAMGGAENAMPAV